MESTDESFALTAKPSRGSGEPFFLGIAVAMLAVVVAGFWPSFYFRGDGEPPLSPYLVAHGVALTAWYVLVVAQPLLIRVGGARGRVALHRRIGMASSVLVAVMLWTGFVVAVAFYRKGPGDIVVSASALLFANLFNLIGLTICYIAGVVHRRNPHVHKRYMTWASVVIIAPATFRLVRGLGLPPWSAAIGQLVFVAVLLVYDYKRTKRIHRPTWIGTAIVLFQMLGSFTIGSSAPWADLAEALFSSN